MVKIIARSDAPAAGSLYTIGGVHDNANEDDEDYDEEAEGAVELAQSTLDTMATSISAKHFAQPALTIVGECFSSSDPKVRKAGGSILGKSYRLIDMYY